MNNIFKKDIECSTDYVLPDYLGDIRKILSVNATAVPAGKFVSGTDINLSGIVNFEVLYSDAEGRLSAFTASADYDAAIPAASEGYIDSYTDTRVTNCGIRLSGPRKLSARAALRLTALVGADEDITPGGDALALDGEAEVLKREIMKEFIHVGSREEREFAEIAERTEAPADSIEIIASSGLVRISEAAVSEGGVTVRGELIVTAIVKADGGAPFAVKKSIPFEETVEIEGVGEGMQAMAQGTLTSVGASVSEDADGTYISVSAILELSAIAAENKAQSVICDAYLKNAATAASYEKLEYSELACIGSSEHKVSAEFSREELGLSENDSIIFASADVKAGRGTPSAGGLNICGEVNISVVACQENESGECTFTPARFSIPYDINVNCGCHLKDDCISECKLDIASVDCSADGDKISAECTVTVFYHVAVPSELERLSECSVIVGGEYEKTSSVVTVYYPEEGETLFGIAKKFRRSASDIAADNSISVSTSTAGGTELRGVKKLIIR